MNKKAFTLIELLVVVLIIGILAAVALPQYQKAVEKSKATQALTLLKSLHQAQNVYHLANGTLPESFDDLDIQMPAWTGSEKWYTNAPAVDVRSNGEWSAQLYKSTDDVGGVFMGRISGPYKGAGFVVFTDGEIKCMERKSSGMTFDGHTKGDYCVKILAGVEVDGTVQPTFALP